MRLQLKHYAMLGLLGLAGFGANTCAPDFGAGWWRVGLYDPNVNTWTSNHSQPIDKLYDTQVPYDIDEKLPVGFKFSSSHSYTINGARDTEFLFFQESQISRSIEITGFEPTYSTSKVVSVRTGITGRPIDTSLPVADPLVTHNSYFMAEIEHVLNGKPISKPYPLWSTDDATQCGAACNVPINALLVNQHGACSVEIPYDQVVSAPDSDKLEPFLGWFSSSSNPAPWKKDYYHEIYPLDNTLTGFSATGFINLDQSSNFAPVGGVSVHAWGTAVGGDVANILKIPVPGGFQGPVNWNDIYYRVTAKIRIDLNNGVLKLNIAQLDSRTDSDGCGLQALPVPHYNICLYDQVENTARDRVTNIVNDMGAALSTCQDYPIPIVPQTGADDIPQVCSTVADCLDTTKTTSLFTKLSAGAAFAKARQADQSGEALAYADKLGALVQDKSNYKCAPVADQCQGFSGITDKRNYCEFRVQAKRLNHYPDGVELVWFDNDVPYQPGDLTTGHALAWIVDTLKSSGLAGTEGLANAEAKLCAPLRSSSRAWYKFVKHY